MRAAGLCPGLKPRADKESRLKPAGVRQDWRLGRMDPAARHAPGGICPGHASRRGNLPITDPGTGFPRWNPLAAHPRHGPRRRVLMPPIPRPNADAEPTTARLTPRHTKAAARAAAFHSRLMTK